MSNSTTPTSISIEQLSQRLNKANAPVCIDVRKEPAYQEHGRRIPSALRVAPDALEQLRDLPRDTPLVVYCIKGHEVGVNAAQTLLQMGFADTQYLQGGIQAWEQDGLPTMKNNETTAYTAGSTWVTRERPKIDRIACPWLVHRFIDATAKFAYVPSDQVLSHAADHNAIAYDVPGVRFTHRGDNCSFDALIADFDLHDAALAKLALIVRGADTARLDLAPESAGLLAISLGLSTTYIDDHAMLAQGMLVYDALYAWCKQTSPEKHGWNFSS
jgi:rhodanese-related sulfurtransferase